MPEMEDRYKHFLLEQAHRFNTLDFIADDPISITHLFDKQEDIEIAALLTALISWGRRDLIIRSARQLMQRMADRPHEFILHSNLEKEVALRGFVHRTFCEADLRFVLQALKRVYLQLGSLAEAFQLMPHEEDTQAAIQRFRMWMLKMPHEKRFEKHLASPEDGSAAKRLHMFLRWMVRKDQVGVDFGCWSHIPMQKLMIPLDVHSGRVAREFGLLQRKQNDRKAVEELTLAARQIYPNDPALLDYALFGLGVSGSGNSQR